MSARVLANSKGFRYINCNDRLVECAAGMRAKGGVLNDGGKASNTNGNNKSHGKWGSVEHDFIEFGIPETSPSPARNP